MSEITSSEMIEKATRMKARWVFRGQCSVEDLWDLEVEELDSIFKFLNAQSKQASEESLLGVPRKENEILAVKLGIVRHIVEVKLAEALARKETSERRARKSQLLEIVQSKQDEELKGKSLDELRQLISELE